MGIAGKLKLAGVAMLMTLMCLFGEAPLSRQAGKGSRSSLERVFVMDDNISMDPSDASWAMLQRTWVSVNCGTW